METRKLMKTIITAALLFMTICTNAQDYITRNGSISFFSHTAVEDIKATNNEVVSVLNSATGSFDFKVAIKSFHFPKTAMEEHFNDEYYMESGKYPKAGFAGKLSNTADVNFTKDGTYNVTVSGNLTIKDVTKPITAKGVITVKNGKVNTQSTFTVKRKEYNIAGQSFAQSKIADEIQITVNCEFEKR